LIGSAVLQQIEAFCADAILRGTKMLDGTIADEMKNSVENQGK